MNIYKARWEHAKKLALRYNKYFEKGYIAILDDGECQEFVKGPFEITEDEVVLRLGDDCGTVSFFVYDENYDDGYYTPIKEITASFKMLTFYQPVKVKGA